MHSSVYADLIFLALLFHTSTFFLFFAVIFTLYWGMGRQRVRLQNLLLLVASYIFYGWWDWRFCGLIALSSLIDYGIGIGLGKAEGEKSRRLLLILSLTANLGMLFVFKYFNFFVDSINFAVASLGGTLSYTTLYVVLPVGISFYTFQTLSYTVDVYKRTIPPCRDPINFFAYVSFFPQLVAGPIERANQLLPQFTRPRTLNEAGLRSAMYLIVWGFFKKLVVADTCGTYADTVFNNASSASTGDLLAGAVFFAFQIYGDFSGYSSIARGVSRLLGFELMVNFRYPYFARNVGEFWRRWHISLSTWFRDYIYIPLGGSKGGRSTAVRNIVIVFLVSGFWHGANWTFLVWGAIHVLMYLPSFLGNTNRKYLSEKTSLRSGHEVFGMVVTFTLVCAAWVFFRAANVTEAISYFGYVFSNFGTDSIFLQSALPLWGILVLFLTLEYHSQGEETLCLARIRLRPLRHIALGSFVLVSFLFAGAHADQSFIYFQF